jgi:hypothetical protein
MSTDAADLAPHVDATWVDAFVIELRLRDVPGDAIGDLLTEVDSHVVDSGATAHDAFGDPVQYAAQMAETAARTAPDHARDLVPSAVGGAALIVVIQGAVAWAGDGVVEVTGGTLTLVAALVAAVLALHRYGTPLLRYLVRASFWRIWALSMVVIGVFVGLSLLLRPWHLVTLPAVPTALAAGALLALAAVLELRTWSTVDPLLRPGADRAAADAAARRDARRLLLVTTAIQVGSVAAAVGVAVVLMRLAG